MPILKIDIDQSRVQSSHMPHFFSYLPLLNYIINLYGSFQKSTWQGGWSFLVYAVAVFLIDYHHGSISDCRDVEQAELRALLQAMKFTIQAWSCSILFLSDCMNLVNFICNKTNNSVAIEANNPFVT